MLKDRKRNEKHLRLNATCPNSPSISSPALFLSEPPSPLSVSPFPTTLLLDKAVEKVKKKKDKKNQSYENDVLSVSMPNIKPKFNKVKRNEERLYEYSEVR